VNVAVCSTHPDSGWGYGAMTHARFETPTGAGTLFPQHTHIDRYTQHRPYSPFTCSSYAPCRRSWFLWVPMSTGVQLAKEKKVKYGDRALAHMKGKLSPECVDLINRCMTVDPAKRPTAASALDHAWFQAKLSPEEAEAVRSSNSPPGLKT
jgi:serine/threonine protein kinase